MDEANKTGVGPLIGTMIVILILIGGAVYLLTLKTSQKENKPTSPTIESIVPINQDLSDIETSVSATELESLDADLFDLENEVTQWVRPRLRKLRGYPRVRLKY